MKKFEITVPVAELTENELTEEDRKLTEEAKNVTSDAYAPYSGFRVGAAILLEDGTVVTGSNQENAAYPSGLCAERTAAFYAHSTYPDKKFRMIAIAARGTDGKFIDNPISPCGGCRQALLEYENLAGEPVEVLLCSDKKIYRLPSIRSLLPLAFSKIE